MKETCLNYVWIHRTKADGKIGKQIPRFFLRNICRESKRNPNIDRFLWIDFNRVSKYIQNRISNTISPHGLEIKNLRDIPAYNNDKIFDPSNIGNVKKGT